MAPENAQLTTHFYRFNKLINAMPVKRLYCAIAEKLNEVDANLLNDLDELVIDGLIIPRFDLNNLCGLAFLEIGLCSVVKRCKDFIYKLRKSNRFYYEEYIETYDSDDEDKYNEIERYDVVGNTENVYLNLLNFNRLKRLSIKFSEWGSTVYLYQNSLVELELHRCHVVLRE